MEKLSSPHEAMLRQHPCFTIATDVNKRGLLKTAKLMRLNKGQFLHHRGDEAIGYYGVVSGRLKANVVSAEGKSLTLSYFQAGDWFGEISLMDGVARTHDAEAIEPCEIILIPKQAFEDFILSDLKSMRIITQKICQRLRTVLNFAEQVTIQPLHVRLAQRILELQSISGNNLPFNQQEIAHMLGVSRQSVSKILLHWAELGWIKLEYNQLTLQHCEHLHALSNTGAVPQLSI